MRWHPRATAAVLLTFSCATLLALADARASIDVTAETEAVALLLQQHATLPDPGPRPQDNGQASIADLVTPYGYPFEHHFVTAADGFILHLHRIPYGKDYGAETTSVGSETLATARRHLHVTKFAARGGLTAHVGASSQSQGQARAPGEEKGAEKLPRQAEQREVEGHEEAYKLPGRAEEGAARPVVLLHHGLLDSSAEFLVLGPGHALGLLLADAGYDVWLTNARGNGQSQRHANLSSSTPEFWAFSFDEIAKYDLPAQLDYIREVTQQDKAAYVGFSQGSTVALAALADQPELAERLTAAALMVPTSFLRHANSPPLALLSKMDTPHILQLLGNKEFNPSQALVQIMSGPLCLLRPHLCVNILAAIGGFNDRAINASKLPLFLRYTPSGTSVQNVAHWAQLMRSTSASRLPTLSHFDWGSDCRRPRRGGRQPMCNLLKYGTAAVPVYRLDRIAVPLMLVTGGQDRLADPLDMTILRRALPRAAVHADLNIPDYEHLDFIWADTAARRVYSKVLDFLASR